MGIPFRYGLVAAGLNNSEVISRKLPVDGDDRALWIISRFVAVHAAVQFARHMGSMSFVYLWDESLEMPGFWHLLTANARQAAQKHRI